jgi:hypothetical protein
MRGRDRDASTPRSRRHRAKLCRRLRPAAGATADAGRLRLCRGRCQRNFSPQRLGQLRARLMRTPACASISARSRELSNCADRPRVPPANRDHTQGRSRAVSSCTPNAAAIRAPAQPASVRSTSYARSASPRSRERAVKASRCSAAILKSCPAPPAHADQRLNLRSQANPARRRSCNRASMPDPAAP